MAAPPKLRRLAMEDFRDTPPDLRPTLQKLVGALNPFLGDVTNAVDKRLTVSDNLAAAYRTVTVTAPAQQWTAPTLLNGWVNYDDTTTDWNAAGYRIDESGRVYLRGLIKSGTATAFTPLFTLPVGYRPASTTIFATVSNDAFGQVRSQADGSVTIVTGSNAWIALDGVNFDATAPAAPPAFVGSGWPLVLRPEDSKGRKIGLQVSDVRLVRAIDVDGSPTSSHGAGAVDWTLDKDRQVVIRRITGLSPGRSYRLTFLMLGG